MRICTSVIIPVYNRTDLLIRALHSVSEQTRRDLEIIVVDDGSNIDIGSVLAEFHDPRLRYLRHQERRGTSAARNTGIDEARGDYLAFLDSDDFWRANKLERQLAYMSAAPNSRPLSCTAFTIVSTGNAQGDTRYPNHPCTHRSLQLGCGLSPGSTLLITKSFLERVGSFNDEMLRLEDWEFLLRCTTLMPIPILHEDLAVVDIRHRDPGQYGRARSAAFVLHNSVYPVDGSRVGRLRLRSYVWREVAASAYNDGRYWLALRHLAGALIIFPSVRYAQLKRLVSRVFRDGFEALASKWRG